MTTLCIFYCDTDKETARQWGEDRAGVNPEQAQEEEKKESEQDQIVSSVPSDAADVFPMELFDDYASRMEHPNPAKRWDQPLF